MFEALRQRVSSAFSKFRKSGALSQNDLDEVLREIRIALLEADVSLTVARKFIEDAKEKILERDIKRSLSPEQAVIKIIYESLVEVLGPSTPILMNRAVTKIMLVGLQGAGKTTTAAKLAKLLSTKHHNDIEDSCKSTVLASVDVYRPAAIEQLRILSNSIGATFANSQNDTVISNILKDAIKIQKEISANLLIIDTAGRLQSDDQKMDELVEIANIVKPDEVILVCDMMAGQDSINVARTFNSILPLTGVILTRADSDAKGGVALCMRSMTGCDIKYVCTGEKLDKIENFDAERIASKILDMGDIEELLSKARNLFDEQEINNSTQMLETGKFTFMDMEKQLSGLSKMGGLFGVLKMLPNFSSIENAIKENGFREDNVKSSIAIIRSMTIKEKTNYKLINGKRRKRIANGSGTSIQDVNRLIKQYETMLSLFKKMKTGKMDAFKNFMSGGKM